MTVAAMLDSPSGGDNLVSRSIFSPATGFIRRGGFDWTCNPYVGLPSNVCFGRGAESKTLYATVDQSLYRIRSNVEGYPIPMGGR